MFTFSYVVRLGEISLNSFSVASLGEEAALRDARAYRDAYNAHNGTDARIVRVKRRDTAHQL